MQVAVAGILRRPPVLKEMLLPSLLPLLLMMTLMALLLLLHCRCRCRRCCRGFHCRYCCCGRCGVCWLLPQQASNSAAAVIGLGGGGFTARAAAASDRARGDASGTSAAPQRVRVEAFDFCQRRARGGVEKHQRVFYARSLRRSRHGPWCA